MLSSADSAGRYLSIANYTIATESFYSKLPFSHHFHLSFVWHVGHAKNRWAGVLSSLLLQIARHGFCHDLQFNQIEYICDLSTVALLNSPSDV